MSQPAVESPFLVPSISYFADDDTTQLSPSLFPARSNTVDFVPETQLSQEYSYEENVKYVEETQMPFDDSGTLEPPVATPASLGVDELAEPQRTQPRSSFQQRAIRRDWLDSPSVADPKRRVVQTPQSSWKTRCESSQGSTSKSPGFDPPPRRQDESTASQDRVVSKGTHVEDEQDVDAMAKEQTVSAKSKAVTAARMVAASAATASATLSSAAATSASAAAVVAAAMVAYAAAEAAMNVGKAAALLADDAQHVAMRVPPKSVCTEVDQAAVPSIPPVPPPVPPFDSHAAEPLESQQYTESLDYNTQGVGMELPSQRDETQQNEAACSERIGACEEAEEVEAEMTEGEMNTRRTPI